MNVSAVTITRPRTPRTRALVREHGSTFVYSRHMDTPQLAILLTCACPGGHGPTHVPWKGWVTKSDAAMEITEIVEHTSPYAIPVSLDVLDGADLDEFDEPETTDLPAAA